MSATIITTEPITTEPITTEPITTDLAADVDFPAPLAPSAVLVPSPRRAALRRTCQRGMVTAEYAVGLLAAIALAMVLVNVFKDGTFKAEMLVQVTKLIGQIGAQIK